VGEQINNFKASAILRNQKF